MAKPTESTAPVAPASTLNVQKGTFLGYQEVTSTTTNKTVVFEVYHADNGSIINSLAGDEVLTEGTRRTLVRTSRDGKAFYWNALAAVKPKHNPSAIPAGFDHV